VWDLLDYPRLLFNTVVIAVVGMIGVLLSCTLVAYGFARFRFPGRNLLFLLLISTIFLPVIVTTIPTYAAWRTLGVLGSSNPVLAWAPLLIPTFFANAYDVFLMRQYFMTIPREMDEAAAMDGASPFRTLISVIIPQAWPVIIAVGIFHFVYSWNNFFEPLIYLSSQPDLQPLAVGLQRFNGIHSREPSLLQAGTLMTLVIPVLVYIVFQRVFTRGVVITGVER
jgi:multiple sugar transport system permease protein